MLTWRPSSAWAIGRSSDGSRSGERQGQSRRGRRAAGGCARSRCPCSGPCWRRRQTGPAPNCAGHTIVASRAPSGRRRRVSGVRCIAPASCLKKRPRPSEIDRPDVRAKRAAFLTWVRRIDPKRLVFLDEAGANIAMGRSHAWVQRGTEYVDARPMNWGDNLTMVGAIRRDRWVRRWCTAPRPRLGRRSSIRWCWSWSAAHDLTMKSRVYPTYKTKYCDARDSRAGEIRRSRVRRPVRGGRSGHGVARRPH